MPQDQRLALIKIWLTELFGSTDFTISVASNDASFRRYFRVSHHGQSQIVMDAPPDKEDIVPFVKIANFLFQQHVNVPEIYAENRQAGFLLLSDFGSQSLLDKLNEDSADQLYKAAIDSLIAIQQCPLDQIRLPKYDSKLLQQELMLFPDWFLTKHLAVEPPADLQQLFDLLIDNANQQPSVIVHRDYHSRNLMATEDNKLGIIDFQDAVVGPISYDLVSLLRDCYISWSQQQVEQWIAYYFSSAQQYNLLPNITLEQFTKWFDLMGLQRHIKVLGIFCRLNYRDKKANYINDLPLTLHYVKQIAKKYPELVSFATFLEQNVSLEKSS